MAEIIRPTENGGGQADVITSLGQFEKDTKYLNDNKAVWANKHPNHWAIVYGENLVGIVATPREVIDLAEKEGIPRNHMVLEYLTTEPVTMIL